MPGEDAFIPDEPIAALMEAARLIALSKSGDLDEADAKSLQQWVEKDPRHAGWLARLQDKEYISVLQRQYIQSQQIAAQELDIFLQNRKTETPVMPIGRTSFLPKWGWAAAVIIFTLGIGMYQKLKVKNENVKVADTGPFKNDIAPGKNGAVLTLADGSQIVLDSLNDGIIASQTGSQAVIRNGKLIYDLTGEKTADAVYNTMSTPKGRQFSLVLPDGTKVWLNAASSIRYPTVFAGAERQVFLTGEAYFEVAGNTRMPFRVNANNKANVKVLGTQFNVNAYENEESLNTTLLEGAVAVDLSFDSSSQSSVSRPVVLKPGQQAVAMVAGKAQTGIRVVNNADISKVMAWKNGLFDFNGLSFEEIMRQLERWYNIEVVYENNKVPDKRLGGKMTRGVSLNDLLKQLGKMGVHYKLEDRTLTVSP